MRCFRRRTGDSVRRGYDDSRTERIPMLPQDIETTAEAVIAGAKAAGLMVATAESCTGGLVSGALTAIAGSSAVLDRGFVTYSNEAKVEMLGVPEVVLARFGAVSEPTARAMAEGAVARSR